MSIKLEHVNYIYGEGTAYEKHALKNINLEKNTVEVEIARGVNIVVDKSYVFADANSPMRQA